MSHAYRIHRLNTGWIESMPGVSLMGEGRHPAVPGGQILPYGHSEELKRPDGSLAPGTMIPAPAWYIEGAERKILVDTGTGKAEEVIAVQSLYGRPLATITEPEHDIVRQLERLGVGAEEIDLVVQTHLHFDHVGSNERFPNATFLVNAKELPWALCPPPFGVYYYREFNHHVKAVLDRIEIVEGERQVAPGIRMVETGGHSPGHSILFVETEVGTAVIAGDAVYNYRNLEYDWPQGPLYDVGAALRAIQTVKRADVILLNHDPFFEHLFPSEVVGAEPLAAETAAYMARLRTAGAFPLADYDRDRDPVSPR
jgi:glyoxylase-like metal-dependent hydrolase (beta-lactamase superfamily II)